jgi:Mad3/BUB1 homology region 1
VWIAYADCLTNSGELFKFLYKNEIGTGLALFWIAWAWVAEYAGDFPLADKVKEQ